MAGYRTSAARASTSLRVRAAAGFVLLLLMLCVGGTSRAGQILLNRAYQSGDLCPLLPSGSDYKVYPGYLLADGSMSSCRVDDLRDGEKRQFAMITVSYLGTKEQAQAHAKSLAARRSANEPDWKPSSFGDAGSSFERPSYPSPINIGESARIVFSRNCYVFDGMAGFWYEGNGTLHITDLAGVRAVAGAADGGMASLPCQDSTTGGGGGGGGDSATATAIPTSTTGPSATPSPTPTVDFRIDHIEVVQAIQAEDNSIPLVAGKKTVARVFVRADAPTSATGGPYTVEVSLLIWPEGKSEVEVPAKLKRQLVIPNVGVDRRVTGDSLNFVIPAELTGPGVFSLKAVVNRTREYTETDYDNNELTEPFEFVQRSGLRVGYVKIGYRPPTRSSFSWPRSDLKTYDTLLRKIIPAPDAGVQYYEMPWRVRVTRSAYTEELGADLLLYLRQFYEQLKEDRPDILVGWISDEYTAGFEYGGLAEDATPGVMGRVFLSTDYPNNQPYSTGVLAHEAGHDLGLEHTGTTGDPKSDCRISENSSSSYWPAEYGNSAAIRILGFDTVQMKVVPDTSYDIMSYCFPSIWISKFHYMRLYDQDVKPATVTSWGPLDTILVRGWGWVRGGGGAPRFEFVRPPGDESGGRTPALSAGTSQPFAARFGLDLASASLAPRLYGRPQVQSEGSGDYCLRFLDSADATLSERCFDMRFTDPETLQPRDQAGFVLSVPDPGPFARAVVVEKSGDGELETASLDPSGAAPLLTITSPAPGDVWQGEQTIRWSADDPDGDTELHYDIAYSADGKKSWFPLAVDLREPEYDFSSDEILPSDNAFIRVMATDGFHTSHVDIGPLIVPEQEGSPRPPPPSPSGVGVSAGDSAGGGTAETQGIMGWPVVGPALTWSRANWPVLASLGSGAAALLLIFAFWRRRRKAPRESIQTQAQVAAQHAAPVPAPAATPAYLVPFEQAMNEYHRLRGELNAGRMSVADFSAAVSRLTLQDANGLHWRIGEEDGRWYYFNGQAWQIPRPPG